MAKGRDDEIDGSPVHRRKIALSLLCTVMANLIGTRAVREICVWEAADDCPAEGT